MHILTVRSSLSDSGPGTQPLVIAQQMRSIGHTTYFATSGGEYVEIIRNSGFEVKIIPELATDRHKLISILLAVAKLYKLIKQEKPDIIHGHNAAATLCAAIAARLAGFSIPCVTSVRGVEERSTHQWRNKIWKYVPGILLGVCQKTRQRLLTFEVPNDRIKVTYNGVDINRFNPLLYNSISIRKTLGLEGKVVVGITGAMLFTPDSLEPTKGQHKLLEAVNLIKDRCPNIHILLIGDGPARSYIENIAAKNKIEEKVIFAGRRFDIPEMLSAMDIYCQPSIFGEFFPNAIIEAMAMGKPWIGSDIAGLNELTAEDKAGWVTPISDIKALADNLERLVKDPNLRISRGKSGLNFVKEQLTIEHVVARILDAYALSMQNLKKN